MEMNYFSRTEALLGKSAMEQLNQSTVAIFGIGGVGSFVAEALARCGVGGLVLVDKDVVSDTNINRQLIATTKTIGCYKTQLMKERIADINPEAVVVEHPVFFQEDTLAEFDFSGYSYVVDAIDTVSSKLLLIEKAKAAGVPVISAMGAGNKLDPTLFSVADIEKTSVCPLAKVMRRELRQRGIRDVKVVFSKEEPRKPVGITEEPAKGKHQVPGSVSFVPSVAGLILASEVVKDLTGNS